VRSALNNKEFIMQSILNYWDRKKHDRSSAVNFWFGKKNEIGHRMSTVSLKNLIDACASDERAIPIIQALKKEMPLASNYVIYFPEHDDAKVIEVSSALRTTNLTIAQHIKLKELHSSCELLISEKQVSYAMQLQALNIKLASTASLGL
jgi:hypothetical protein